MNPFWKALIILTIVFTVISVVLISIGKHEILTHGFPLKFLETDKECGDNHCDIEFSLLPLVIDLAIFLGIIYAVARFKK